MCTWLSISPGTAVVPAASITTSQPATASADSVPISTILPSLIRMPSPVANGWARSPVTIVPMLTIAVRMEGSVWLVQPVLANDGVGGQASNARVEAAAIGKADDQRDFVGGRRVRRQCHRDAVVM